MKMPGEEPGAGAVRMGKAVDGTEPMRVEPKTSAVARCWRQIGGGSLLLSVGVHVALLLLAGVVLVGTHMVKPAVDFLPAGQTQAGVVASHALSELVRVKGRSAMAKKMPLTHLRVEGGEGLPLPEPDENVLPAGMGLEAGGGKLKGTSLGLGLGGDPGMGGPGPAARLHNLPHLFGARCSSQSRLEKLRENGGTPECEMAVSRSLAWLKSQQNADGSWGRNNKAAMTGLTLLCYLGRCETPESMFYGDNVRNGMLYLVELARKNPYGILAEQPLSNSATYEHGIATYALGEMYSFYRLGNSSLPGLRETFEKGVRTIIAEQTRKGAWTYGGKDAGMPHAYNKESGGEDLSVTGWQFQALKAAKHSG